MNATTTDDKGPIAKASRNARTESGIIDDTVGDMYGIPKKPPMVPLNGRTMDSDNAIPAKAPKKLSLLDKIRSDKRYAVPQVDKELVAVS